MNNTILTLYSETNGTYNVSLDILNTKFTAPSTHPVQILVINLSTSNEISANITTTYQCSILSTSVVPYELIGGTWNPIESFTINPNTCTISFAIPNDLTIGVFASTTPVLKTTSTMPTTATTTIAPTTTIQQKSQNNGMYYEIAAAVIALVIIIAIAALLINGRKNKELDEYRKRRDAMRESQKSEGQENHDTKMPEEKQDQ